MKLSRDQRKKFVMVIMDVINFWADDWGIEVSVQEELELAQAIADSDLVLDLFRIQAQPECSRGRQDKGTR